MDEADRRSHKVNWGIPIVMLVLAAIIHKLWALWILAAIGAGLILNGYFPRAFSVKKIFFALGLLVASGALISGCWFFGHRRLQTGTIQMTNTAIPQAGESKAQPTADPPPIPPCGPKPVGEAGGVNGSALSGTTESVPTSDSVSVKITRGSSASGATIRDFVTRGSKAIYEVSMDAPPGWRAEELEFRFPGNKAIDVKRAADFPQSLKDSGYPLVVERLTERGFDLRDGGCPGISYRVIWLRGSEIEKPAAPLPANLNVSKATVPNTTNNCPYGICISGGDLPRFSLPVVIWKFGFHTTVS